MDLKKKLFLRSLLAVWLSTNVHDATNSSFAWEPVRIHTPPAKLETASAGIEAKTSPNGQAYPTQKRLPQPLPISPSRLTKPTSLEPGTRGSVNEKTPLFAPVSVSAFPPKANGEDVKVVTSESKNTKPLTEIASVPGPAPVNVASFSKSHSTMPHRASVSELTKQPDLPSTPNRDVAWSVSDTLAPTLPDQIERSLEPITIARFNADAIAEKGFLDGGFLESDHQLLVSALASDDDDVEAQELNANPVDPSSAPKEPATKKNDSLATASPESKRDSKPVQEDSLATLPPTPSMLIADEQQLLNLSLVLKQANA